MNKTTKLREKDNISRPDILHLLLKASKDSNVEITQQDIAAQAMIFFLGGFETISSGLCFTIYELALNPVIQKKLQKEIDNVWEQQNGEITFEIITKMKYLDMVISGTDLYLLRKQRLINNTL